MLPPPPNCSQSRCLGPTPRERRQAFEAHTTEHRAAVRGRESSLTRSSTAPGSVANSFPAAYPNRKHRTPPTMLKKTSSMSSCGTQHLPPFYTRMGDIPRELKNVNAKIAMNIVVEPKHKQLLREKIVYFFPNNDISMARRLRIHKIIQLGAAWVKHWRDDVTHVVFDDDKHTYSQLIRHLNLASLQVSASIGSSISAKRLSQA